MNLLTAYLLLQIVVFTLLGMATFYIFIFALAGLFYKQAKYAENPDFRKIAVLIPGYKEDEVIVEVAEEALKQDYPAEHYDVVVIADSFQPDTILKLKALPIKVIEVSFEKSTKSKALNKAMALLTEPYDLAVILDADNIMATHFLSKINATFEGKHTAVQGHRTAKNTNTSLAILDSASEEINNHLFRKGHRALGLSSAIIGSGMAFRYDFFRNMMATVTAIGGFDKEIELKMLKEGHTIEYLDDALVYDEKVQKAEVFSNQRRRWLSAQFHYFAQDFPTAIKALLLKGNIDYFDKAIQFIQPPRVLLLGADIVLSLLFLLLNLTSHFTPQMNQFWLILASTCLLAFLFALPRSFFNRSTAKALASLPKGMLLMLRSLFRLKGANKHFIHTQHTSSKSDSSNLKTSAK
jgi:cellulose synthase/poly-beta-1,6-N-acetylglucosamine synthase-like glycosyltransferase